MAKYTVKSMGRGLYVVIAPNGMYTSYTTSDRAEAARQAAKLNKASK